ncbi:MAG: hypothetical protein FWB72_01300 [Firmicutes bacterium]|nr:hypothetical protein [Bacillota bacterium]
MENTEFAVDTDFVTEEVQTQVVTVEAEDKGGKYKKIMMGGLLRENALFRMALALCPIVVVTSTAFGALFMGLATLLVLALATLITNLLIPVIDSRVRIPIYLAIVATLVIVVRMSFAWIEDTTGIPVFTPIAVAINLIVVNCIIFGRIEGFATKRTRDAEGNLIKANNPGHAVVDGIFMGLGLLGALVILGAIREILGLGTIFEIELAPVIEDGGFMAPIGVISTLAGGLLTLGILMAAFNQIYKKATQPKAPFKRPEKVAQEVA